MANALKETKYCPIGKIQIKEDDKEFHVSGFVATEHPDRASVKGTDYVGDVLPKSTLDRIAEQINDTYSPEASAVSESHDWIKQENPNLPLAGVAVSPATVQKTDDGKWGVHVDTVLSKTNPRLDEVRTNIEQGVYPGFSIEYETNKFVPTVIDGKTYRMLTDITTKGFGYANRRNIANPRAEITSYGYKEIMNIKETNQGDTMSEENQPPAVPPKVEDKKEEVKPEEKKEDAPAEPVAPAESKEFTITPEQMAKLTALEAKEKKTASQAEVKEAVDIAVKEILGAQAPMLNAACGTGGKKRTEFKEMVEHPYHKAQMEMKELDKPMASNELRAQMHKQIVSTQYKEAANVCNEAMGRGVPVFSNWLSQSLSGELEMKQLKVPMQEVGNRIEIKETNLHKIEMKAGEGLQTDTNLAHTSWTYGSYYQSPVDLNDIYGQALINQLNDQTTTWGKLKKEDWSGRSQIQFRARTGRNSTAGGYSEGANLTYGTDFTGTIGRQKFQQPFSYYRVLVAVTGQEIQFAKAPGGMGDIWANEIQWSGQDLLVTLNQAIIGTGAGTSEAASLGFEGLILGSTGTLYGRNIATYTTLKSHKESVTGRVDLEQIRKMIRYCEAGDTSSITNSNANRNDLVFFCNHLQRDFVYSLIQDMQRTVPVSARVGFEGVLSVDGVPVFADKDINTDDLFLIDTMHTKIGMNLPPTLEALPVTADAKAAQIKTYFNLYSDAPSNNYWAYGLATS